MIKICLICVEFFAWGKYGGFGRAARIIGSELAKRGIHVFAIVPRREGQKPVEHLDGITILSFSPKSLKEHSKLYRECDADIYHSQEPSLGTFLALRAMPNRKHIVTFRDPRETDDWKIEFKFPSHSRWQVAVNYLYENNFFIAKAVRRADVLFCAAKCLIPKAQHKYQLADVPEFLPTPVAVPEKIQKALFPTVCFVSRWDRRKRPEIFFELARKFQKVKFLAIGQARDKKWEKLLYRKYSELPNLEMRGFVNQFHSNEHSHILEDSWIFVNTALREGLPNAFLEAAAHQCAILSAVNPDGFASQFGYHVHEDDFENGLHCLLENERWKKRGYLGYKYVKETFEINRAIDQHVAVYERAMGLTLSPFSL